jgi:hypothetical protein
MPGKLERNRTKVIRDLASGRPQAEIARDIGIHPASVCRFAQQDNVKEAVKQEAMRLLEALPDAVQNVKDLIQEMRNLPREDYKSRELSYKASVKVLESAGIVNSQAQNQVMVNIFNNNQTLISPAIQTFITKLIGNLPEDPLDIEQGENME